MKMKMLNAATAAALSVLAAGASAAGPAKTGDIGSAEGRVVSCTIGTIRLDLEKGFVMSGVDADITLKKSLDGSYQYFTAEKAIDLGGNDGILLSLIFMPNGGAKNGDLLNSEATLFRLDSQGYKIVLDQASFSSMDERLVGARMQLGNTELSTVAVNQKEPVPVDQLVKEGLVPNGTLSRVSVSCYMPMK